jgi:hypothetical protein
MNRSEAVVPCLSGVAAQDCLSALEEIVGADTYAAAHQRLASHVRREIDTMTAVSWVPIGAFNAFVDEIARSAGLDPDPMLDQAIRQAIQRTFTTVWRVLLRVTTDEALIKRTPMIYSRGRNVGALHARLVQPGHGELSLTGWIDPAERTLRTIGLGIQCVVELAGRREVRMTYARTSDGARYRLSWRV